MQSLGREGGGGRGRGASKCRPPRRDDALVTLTVTSLKPKEMWGRGTNFIDHIESKKASLLPSTHTSAGQHARHASFSVQPHTAPGNYPPASSLACVACASTCGLPNIV